MMNITHKINIDLVRRGVKPVIDAVQNDTGSRTVEISLFENGVPWEIPAKTIFLVKYKRQDGSGGTYDTLPDGNKACSAIGNTVSVVLVSPILSKSGLIDVQIQMDIDNNVLSTFAFLINAEKEASGSSSGGGSGSVPDGDYTNIQMLVQQEVRNALEDAQESGKFDGQQGATFIPAVSPEGVISWSNDRGLENPEPVDIKGPKGEPGKDGTSVTVVSVEESNKSGSSNTVTFSDGTTLIVKNGKDGAMGTPGYNPGISVEEIEGGHRITVRDWLGSDTFDVMDGTDGKTPVKGVDYFTEADKAEMVADVKEALANDDAPEIIITTNEHGYWYNNNGVPEFYAPTDGNAVCSQETNYIKATKGDAFRVTTRTSDGHHANGAWYDANKNVISIIIVKADSQIVKTVDLTAPAGTAYARFFTTTWNTIDYLAPLEVEYLGQGAENTEPASPLKGKKIVYDGDSICSSWGISTNGGSYPQIIADIVGGTFDNQGVGGGRIVTQEGSSDTFHSIVDNLVNLPTDGDLYCFEGGVNDHWHDVPLGTFSESDYTGALDKTTYCGALETIFRYATTKFVGKPTCYIIVHKCPYSAFSKYGTEHTFADFREAALGICEKYSIPVYDAWKDSGINSWNSAQLANFFIMDDDTGTGDGTHPNEAGYRRYYVPQLIDLFERIMPIGVENIESPEEPAEPTYTNVLDTVGWKDGVYLSNGNESVDVNACTSGYIPITTIPSTIYLKNVTMPDETSHGNRVGYYKADKSFYAQMSITSSYSDARPVFGEDGNLKQFYVSANGVAYIRVNAWQIDATSVITINEPIE